MWMRKRIAEAETLGAGHTRGCGAGCAAFSLLFLTLLLLASAGCRDDAAPPGATGKPRSVADWKAQRAKLDETVWADETLAQEYERTLVALWDALLAAGHDSAAKVAVLSSLEFEELTIGAPRPVEELEHGIRSFALDASSRMFARADWEAFLGGLAGEGYRLIQSEWHHARFFPASAASPARSSIAVVLHVVDDGTDRRIIVEGELAVEWSARRDARDNPIPAKIDATSLRMLTRAGPPPFQQVFGFALRDKGTLYGLHPILLYDLDNDGFSEVVMVSGTHVLWNLGKRGFRDAPLLAHRYQLTESGVIADLNGDSHPDLLSARARGDLVLYLGDEAGRFSDEPRPLPPFDPPLRAPSALTVGDVDGDGDLDAWVAQYKRPYQGGQMPSPYYDANDGYPAYLLLNDGDGGFTTATEAAGLAAKRYRRTYASSFVDLDDDRDLDLVVVSDFSGVDLYHNDGRGNFVDANDTLRADRHLFGMSASFADFDLDGRLDFFVAGMASTTARRLEALGMGRDDRPEMQEMRMRMALGNRMYLAADAGWQQPEFYAQVARTGWTWGTTAFDFDNDGDPDIFAANGNESGESTKDYCTNFWTHDIFDGESEPDSSLENLLNEVGSGLNVGAESWDGYQKNHLLMNRGGKAFVNVAFLLGVADEFDSRSAVSGDLDLDGRVDLVVVENDRLGGQKLHIYRNQLETDHHWIGIQLREEGGGISPVGASVTVRTAEQTHVGRVMTGETLMSQHSTTLHFGLGNSTEVESIEVEWIGGMRRVIRDPEIDRYHPIRARESEDHANHSLGDSRSDPG
jgi:hypothetical protein